MVTIRSEPELLTLRQEHVARTRERLLEAAVDLLVTDGADEFSLREVAKRAGVSAPTAYRHFATKEAMYEALQAYFEDHVGDPGIIRNIDELVEALPTIHDGFLQQARVVTAYARTLVARDLRASGRKRRAKRVGKAVKTSLPSLSGADLNAFSALTQLFVSTAPWELWRETWQLDGARAGRVAAWAVRTLYEAVRKNPKAFISAVHGDMASKEEK